MDFKHREQAKSSDPERRAPAILRPEPFSRGSMRWPPPNLRSRGYAEAAELTGIDRVRMYEVYSFSKKQSAALVSVRTGASFMMSNRCVSFNRVPALYRRVSLCRQRTPSSARRGRWHLAPNPHIQRQSGKQQYEWHSRTLSCRSSIPAFHPLELTRWVSLQRMEQRC